jgi:hypothetical protein
VDFTEVGPPLSDDDLAERAGTNIAWATDQLRAAFPGAEEIQS